MRAIQMAGMLNHYPDYVFGVQQATVQQGHTC
jgi:hypothetical protein